MAIVAAPLETRLIRLRHIWVDQSAVGQIGNVGVEGLPMATLSSPLQLQVS